MTCPICAAVLVQHARDVWCCGNGHRIAAADAVVARGIDAVMSTGPDRRDDTGFSDGLL